MGHNPRNRDLEAQAKIAKEERGRQERHYQRSEAAWLIAEKKGVTWQDFRKTPMSTYDGQFEQPGEPRYPWTSTELPSATPKPQHR